MYSAENCDATITTEAYCKINLHGARYASEVVCGFLVGSIQSKGAGKEAQICVEDALPICHSNPVGPIFEVAGAMMKTIFPTKQVVGLYYTSVDGDYGNDESTPYFVDKLCDTIKGNNGKEVCLVLTVAVNKINPAPNVDDVESDDDMSSVLCLNAYMTNSMRSGSSSSSKQRGSGRERTASFQSFKLPLEAIRGTGQELNAALDQLLLGGKQYGLEDVQSQLAGVPDVSPQNQHINIECGLLSGRAK